MKLHVVTFFSLTLCHVFAQQKLQSPEEFLGYKLGDQFTRHHRMVEYYRHIADALSNVDVIQYGETYEQRPLIYAVVTAPENFKNLDKIRLDNLRRAGMEEGTPSADRKAIIWLSYNVHGNEANSMEASMWTLYDLVNPNNTKTQEWLKNTIVIFDPCLNPDGRDRYANFYNQYGNFPPNSNGDSREHREPWPGGRANHYLYDLNRDWAWQTQIESQHRIKIYNQWMPHVHVDFHEQGHNNHYFFAPSAEPFHEVISPWQREFQIMIGKNNAKYFDEQGWLYFTKEVFDLYYPGYADTYSTYSGAIGMTYEQAGGGFGGLSVATETGEPLTLKDRIMHHHTTGLATVEVTSRNMNRVVEEFEKYFRENNNNPSFPYKTYVIRSDNNPDKLKQLTSWLDTHGIRYGHASSSKTFRGFDYQIQAQANFTLTPDDIVVNIFQPKSRFITTLFEPHSKLADSLTYDITAWNVMYAYNLKAFALSERINPNKPYQHRKAENDNVPSMPYAYIFNYQSLKDVELLTALMQKGINVRASEKSFSINGKNFEPGSLLVTRSNNESVDLDKSVLAIAKQLDRKIYTVSSGFMDKGNDMGSSDVHYLNKPRIATLFGDQTSSLSCGEIWHFFEQQLHYPITQIGTEYFKNVDLKKYDILIIPDGNYTLFDESMLDEISSWVSRGGKLILIGQSLNNFSEKKEFALQPYASDEEKEKMEKEERDHAEKKKLTTYEEADRKQVSDGISGAIYKISMDKSHPLGFGLSSTYYTLKTSDKHFAFLNEGWNVGVIRGTAKPVQGFAGFRANKKLDNSLVFGVEDKGQGHIIYLVDNPLFRNFWAEGKMLFANAVFMVGQ